MRAHQAAPVHAGGCCRVGGGAGGGQQLPVVAAQRNLHSVVGAQRASVGVVGGVVTAYLQ